MDDLIQNKKTRAVLMDEYETFEKPFDNPSELTLIFDLL